MSPNGILWQINSIGRVFNKLEQLHDDEALKNTIFLLDEEQFAFDVRCLVTSLTVTHFKFPSAVGVDSCNDILFNLRR